MRYLMILILAGGVMGAAAGCGPEPSAPSATGQPSREPELGASSAPSAGSGPTGAPTAPPSAPPPTTETATPPPETATPTPPPGPGELPGGLPHGERTLTGVIERSGGCTLLRVDSRRWRLTGTLVEGLVDGSSVTVVGQITTGTECAGQEMTRTLIVRRVTPS